MRKNLFGEPEYEPQCEWVLPNCPGFLDEGWMNCRFHNGHDGYHGTHSGAGGNPVMLWVQLPESDYNKALKIRDFICDEYTKSWCRGDVNPKDVAAILDRVDFETLEIK